VEAEAFLDPITDIVLRIVVTSDPVCDAMERHPVSMTIA